ncbi:MAG: DNA/RNA nuclease SfsA [Thermodesulfobacteriota bacterium]|nr:DNA/RNA nuclease SfsA [Thermodesulfobacteriota bacterium]
MTDNGYCLPLLKHGRLIKRYKRFLADIELETGGMVTAHCPNSGSMKGCAVPGAPVWISESTNPARKLKYTWELIQMPESMIGINTQVPNKLVKQAIEQGIIQELAEYKKVTSEVKTSSHTRLDLLLEKDNGEKCYVEIKNCTLVEEGTAMFPDAVTTRGQKHLEELQHLTCLGHRAVIFYLIQRMDAREFKPASRIDPAYAEKLKTAVQNKVEVITRDTVIDTFEIKIGKSIPVIL